MYIPDRKCRQTNYALNYAFPFTFVFSYRAKRDPSINTTWVYQQIQHLGKLYDYKINDKLDYQQFQDLLERIDVPHETGVYDTLSRMYMVYAL